MTCAWASGPKGKFEDPLLRRPLSPVQPANQPGRGVEMTLEIGNRGGGPVEHAGARSAERASLILDHAGHCQNAAKSGATKMPLKPRRSRFVRGVLGRFGFLLVRLSSCETEGKSGDPGRVRTCDHLLRRRVHHRRNALISAISPNRLRHESTERRTNIPGRSAQ